jgi:hypothetical protein
VTHYLIRTEGGPHPGTRVTDTERDLFTWPLPEALADEGGQYIKISESRMPEDAESDNLMRGAVYKWVPS